jgi:2-dehydro-3-deoxyphosphogluconate aldolase/(4S)-4-hydroxy-2-oxoglutarate aldolase
MANDIADIMTISPVIPVIVIEHPEQALPLATALVEGGLKVLEVTLRTGHGLPAIREIASALPEAFVGAGTVTEAEQIDAVIEAGGQFMVSPGSTPRLIEAALEKPIALLPGIATPSEAMSLMEYGLRHMKFFPAEAAGGVPMLKSIGGPLPQITFCPTGGIGPDSAREYLGLANVACVGGSWMVPQRLIDSGDWAGISSLAREASKLAPVSDPAT